MFDWNDEELSNIIWDEATESDDHIVPYPEASGEFCKKKEWSQEAKNVKSNGQKATGNKVDNHDRKLGSSSNFDSSEGTSTSGFGIDSWPNLSLSTAAKTDQRSLDTSVSNNLTEITKFDSSGGADTVQLDKEAGTFQKDKEQGDFVDYGWANIGSFDDLDRIFSNDDPLFGTGSLGNSDELWSSSKDVTNSPEKSFPIYADSPTLGLGPLKSTSENFEIKTEYVQEDEPFTLNYGKVSGPTSLGAQNPRNVLDHLEYAGGESKPMMKQQTDLSVMGKDTTVNSQLASGNVGSSNQLANKVYKQKKPSKSRKRMGEQSELTLYQNIYGDWSSAGTLPSQFKNQFAPSVLHSSASLLDQTRRSLQGPESLQYQQIPNPLLASSPYGTVPNPYSAMPVLSHIQSGEFKQQPLLSSYEVSSGNPTFNPVSKSTEIKRPTMTPQEKIEKLRKRQQMQALLAIQKQQQQLGHQVSSSSDHSMSQKCCQENQLQNIEGSDLEVDDLTTFPAFDPNSPLEQDDSSTISLAGNDYSAEDTVLYRLQDIISKLDVRIRLCIRDSLFRLAQSATQRNYASDTTSSNISNMDERAVAKEEVGGGGHSRNAKMSEAETETNPIDRTVAHLLFHRPFELSGKPPETPDSPASSKLPNEQKAMGLAKPSMGCLPEIGKSKQVYSLQGPKICPLTDSQTAVSCIDNSDTSNNGPANDGLNEIEASQ